jgi:hypothetical protein
VKLRELKHGGATIWPPQRVDSAGPGDLSVEDGVLEGVERFGRRLLVRINIHGHRFTARLQWDPPPAVGDVEVMLLASIGAQIRDLGDRELPARAGGTHR